MTIIVRSMYNFVNCLQFNIRYEKVERPAPVGGALVVNKCFRQIPFSKLHSIIMYICNYYRLTKKGGTKRFFCFNLTFLYYSPNFNASFYKMLILIGYGWVIYQFNFKKWFGRYREFLYFISNFEQAMELITSEHASTSKFWIVQIQIETTLLL